jgi:glycosyltransferase involved in cell wall biosynthesis
VEAYVGEAIKSVLSQTYQGFELVVINDGSDDSSMEIVRSYAATDSRIKIVSQKNRGLAAARNVGVEIAKGRYFYFFDSDDLLEPDALAVCMDYVERLSLDLVAFSGREFSENPMLADKFLPYEKPDILIPHSGQELLVKLVGLGAYAPPVWLYLFSREILTGMDLRFDKGFLHEDEGFTPLLFCAAKRAISLNKILFNRRLRENSIMTAPRTLANVEGMIQAVVKIENFCNSRPELGMSVRRALRARQRRLLRHAVSIAQGIGLYRELLAIVRLRFGLPGLFLMDPLALIYIGLGRFYFRLRAIKRTLVT